MYSDIENEEIKGLNINIEFKIETNFTAFSDDELFQKHQQILSTEE